MKRKTEELSNTVGVNCSTCPGIRTRSLIGDGIAQSSVTLTNCPLPFEKYYVAV